MKVLVYFRNFVFIFVLIVKLIILFLRVLSDFSLYFIGGICDLVSVIYIIYEVFLNYVIFFFLFVF